MTARSPDVHGTGKYLELSQGPVYYEVEGSGPPVLLVPGGPGAAHVHYHPWFSRLAETNAVVYFDQLGTGRSDRLADPAMYTIQLYAETIERLRDHLGAERIALVGISFGGLAALEYAAVYRDRLTHLVLSNGQLSAQTWQESNIDNVNRELANQFPTAWAELGRLRGRGVTSLAPEYQAALQQVLPDLERADPWGHPRLRQDEDPREEFAEDVYRAFVGDDPEWTVGGTLAGFDPIPRSDPRDHGATRSRDDSARRARDRRRVARRAAQTRGLRAERPSTVGRGTGPLLRSRPGVPAKRGDSWRLRRSQPPPLRRAYREKSRRWCSDVCRLTLGSDRLSRAQGDNPPAPASGHRRASGSRR